MQRTTFHATLARTIMVGPILPLQDHASACVMRAHAAGVADVCLVHLQASTAPAAQPKVNTTASEFYVLQYTVRVAKHALSHVGGLAFRHEAVRQHPVLRGLDKKTQA